METRKNKNGTKNVMYEFESGKCCALCVREGKVGHDVGNILVRCFEDRTWVEVCTKAHVELR